MPSYIHTDRGSSFMSKELREYLTSLGIATSRTTPYNPQGNGQCERYNGIVWKHIRLALTSRNLPEAQWETVLPEVLHSIRSLLCTATNATPHERLFSYQRRSPSGHSLPSWLATPGPVLLRRHARTNKYEPLVEEVQLLEANPQYAHVRFPDGRESTVSMRDLAPVGNTSLSKETTHGNIAENNEILTEDPHSVKEYRTTNSSETEVTSNEDTQPLAENIPSTPIPETPDVLR